MGQLLRMGAIFPKEVTNSLDVLLNRTSLTAQKEGLKAIAEVVPQKALEHLHKVYSENLAGLHPDVLKNAAI